MGTPRPSAEGATETDAGKAPEARKQIRQSNMELLRIVAMLGIVAHHAVVHGGFFADPASAPLSVAISLQFLAFWGKVGVDVFVLISGYFSSLGTGPRTGRVLSLWLQLLVTSVGIWLAFELTGTPTPEKSVIGARELALPVASSIWWFASAFFALQLLSPVLNAAMRSMGRGAHRRVLAALTAVWCVLPSATGIGWMAGNVAWFCYLHMLAGYIRRYDVRPLRRPVPWLLVALAASAVASVACAWVARHPDSLAAALGFTANAIRSENRLPCMVAAVSLLLAFREMGEWRSRVVNAVAATTFGVYLLHDHPWVRRWLWRMVVGHVDVSVLAAGDVLLRVSATVLAVFCACAALEAVRRITVGLACDWAAKRVLAPAADRALDRLLPLDGGAGAEVEQRPS